MDDYIFKELKSVLDRYANIQKKLGLREALTCEENEFFRNYQLYFAKAISNEIPNADKVAKMILVKDNLNW